MKIELLLKYFKIIFFLIIVILFNPVQMLSQVSLNELYQKAMEHYPIAKLKGLYDQKENKELDIVNYDYYPKVQFFGQITYQSSVPKLDIEIPIPNFSMPELKNDQYKFGVNIDQLIWDGGIISSKKELVKVDSDIEINQTEVDLYKIRRRIDDLGFGIMMLNKQIKLYEYKQEILAEKQKSVRSAVENGMLPSINSDQIDIEILTTEREKIGIVQERSRLIRTINVLCGTDLKDDIEIDLPKVLKDNNGNNLRPEFKVFSGNKQKFEKMKDLSSSIAMPKISAFAQAGYFQPGYNLFDPEFEAVYMVGLKMAWSPIDFVRSNYEKDKLTLAQEIVVQQEKAFVESINIEHERIYSHIDRLTKQSKHLENEIELREELVKKTNARFENGDLLFSDYIQELNASLSAKLKKDLLSIDLLKATYELLTIDGEE